MITITFPDKSTKEFACGTTPMQIAESISPRLAQDVLAATVNGQPWDLSRPLDADAEVQLHKWEDPEGKHAFWHSSAHLLAEALQELYPGVKFGIGPAIENGFYYDIDLLLAISIGRIANISIGDISKAIDITQGEIVLYKAGKESVITDIVSNNTIVLSAVETKLPEYNAFGYNLKNRGATYPTTVSLDSVEYSGSDLAISNGVITVLNPERKFSKLLTLQYDTGYGKIIEVKTTFKYDGTVYMDKADFDYNKSNAATNKNNIEIKLSGTMINRQRRSERKY